MTLLALVSACGEPEPTATPTASPSPSPAEPVKIGITTHFTDKFLIVQADQRFIDLVTERTNGQVEFELFPASQLFKGTEAFDAISTGKIEAGCISQAYYGGIRPEWDWVNLPFVTDSWDHLYRAWDAGWKDIVEPAFEENNMHVVSPAFWLWIGFGGKSPIEKPEDFKGQKVRMFGKLQTEWGKLLDAAPVVMSSSEIYLAMQRGTIDAYFTGWSSVISRSLYEVTASWTAAPVSFTHSPLVINKELWDSLPKDVQDIMTQAGKEAYRDWLKDAQSKADEATLSDMAAKGVEVAELTPEQLELWQKSAEPVYDIYLESAGALGEQLLDIAEETR
jgi:TRAP-type C4-dicarboxylate transport system substrate-binding protein